MPSLRAAHGTDKAPWADVAFPACRTAKRPKGRPPTQSRRLFGSSMLASTGPLRREQTRLQGASCACRRSRPLPPGGPCGQWAAAQGRLAAGESLCWGDCTSITSPKPHKPFSNHQQPSNRRPHRASPWAVPALALASFAAACVPVRPGPSSSGLMKRRDLHFDLHVPASPWTSEVVVLRRAKSQRKAVEAGQGHHGCAKAAGAGCTTRVGDPSHIGFWLASPPDAGPSNPVARLSAQSSQPGSQ